MQNTRKYQLIVSFTLKVVARDADKRDGDVGGLDGVDGFGPLQVCYAGGGACPRWE